MGNVSYLDDRRFLYVIYIDQQIVSLSYPSNLEETKKKVIDHFKMKEEQLNIVKLPQLQ